MKMFQTCTIEKNYHSLSIKMVPTSVESAANAPDTLVNSTSERNAAKLVDFKVENLSNAITVHPAIIKEKF